VADFVRDCGLLCSVKPADLLRKTHFGRYPRKNNLFQLKYLGEFSDPLEVRLHLAATEKQDTQKYEVELKGVEKRLTDLEVQFLSQLDGLLKRKVLT
jgi:hypothetical protein